MYGKWGMSLFSLLMPVAGSVTVALQRQPGADGARRTSRGPAAG